MASFRCYDNSDVIATLIMTNFHLNTTVVAIFPNVCLWRRSLCSNLAGIDPEKLYRGTFMYQYGLCCCIVWPSFKNLGNLQKFYLGKWFTAPPGRKLPVRPPQFNSLPNDRPLFQTCLVPLLTKFREPNEPMELIWTWGIHYRLNKQAIKSVGSIQWALTRAWINECLVLFCSSYPKSTCMVAGGCKEYDWERVTKCCRLTNWRRSSRLPFSLGHWPYDVRF